MLGSRYPLARSLFTNFRSYLRILKRGKSPILRIQCHTSFWITKTFSAGNQRVQQLHFVVSVQWQSTEASELQFWCLFELSLTPLTPLSVNCNSVNDTGLPQVSYWSTIEENKEIMVLLHGKKFIQVYLSQIYIEDLHIYFFIFLKKIKKRSKYVSLQYLAMSCYLMLFHAYCSMQFCGRQDNGMNPTVWG